MKIFGNALKQYILLEHVSSLPAHRSKLRSLETIKNVSVRFRPRVGGGIAIYNISRVRTYANNAHTHARGWPSSLLRWLCKGSYVLYSDVKLGTRAPDVVPAVNPNLFSFFLFSVGKLCGLVKLRDSRSFRTNMWISSSPGAISTLRNRIGKYRIYVHVERSGVKNFTQSSFFHTTRAR